MDAFIKRYLPQNLLGRALLIIVTPLVLLQVVSAIIFYETHWNKVSYRLAKSVAGDIAHVIHLRQQFGGSENWPSLESLFRNDMELLIAFEPDAILPNTQAPQDTRLDRMMERAMRVHVRRPYRLDTKSLAEQVAIDVQLSDGVMRVTTTRKRLFSSTIYVFVLWMVGTSLILFGVATVFMRNQVRPIRRLAWAAENFGKGRDVTRFKPEGAREVRQAAQAFLAMKGRIERQIRQRTDMLSGVSHDLRTPLTRMKLQMAMSQGMTGTDDLLADIADMERMLEGYLAFARGEGTEKPVETDVSALLADVIGKRGFNGAAVDLHLEDDIEMPVRPNAFSRGITNLVENASRYGQHVSVRAGRRDDMLEITVDDDGPGIPEADWTAVFKPFYRVDPSRNPVTGGVGLGLTIARDVMQSHGGQITLEDSPLGGLRARVQVPL